MTDFKTPLINESVKSVKSVKSAKSSHESFESSINNNMADNTNKLKDSDNNSNFDRIILDKSSLKEFLKKYDKGNAQGQNTIINDKQNKKNPPASDSDSQKNFEKKLNDLLVSKKGHLIESQTKSKSNNSNKISNSTSGAANSTQTTLLEQTKSIKEKPQSSDKRQEAAILLSNSVLGITSSTTSNPNTKEYSTNKPSIQPDTGNISNNLVNTTSNQSNPPQSIQKNSTSNNSPYY